jgi:hypothetical protein
MTTAADMRNVSDTSFLKKLSCANAASSGCMKKYFSIPLLLQTFT